MPGSASPVLPDAVSKVDAYFKRNGLARMALAYYYRDYILGTVAPRTTAMIDVAIALDLSAEGTVGEFKKELQRRIWNEQHHQRELAQFLLANGALQQMVQPFAYGATLNLHPLAVLIVTVGAGALFGMVGLVMTLCWPPGIGHPADASATITRSYCIVLSAMPRTVRTGGGRQRERGKDTARKERKETHHLARRCWVLTRS